MKHLMMIAICCLIKALVQCSKCSIETYDDDEYICNYYSHRNCLLIPNDGSASVSLDIQRKIQGTYFITMWLHNCIYTYPKHQYLGGLGKMVNSSIRSILIDTEDIQQMPRRMFCNVPNVSNVILVNVGISDAKLSIVRDVCPWETNEHLSTLDLSNNNVKVLKNNTFKRFPHLTKLNISGNGIIVVQQGAFAGLKKLRYLSLDRNRLEYLPKNVFVDTPELFHLSLVYNNMADHGIPNFNHLPKLQFLNLDHNNVKSILEDMFTNLTLLKELHFASNSLNRISMNTFSNKEINVLTLRNNSVTSIECEGLSNSVISSLDLTGNHFNSVPDLNQCHGIRSIRLTENNIYTITSIAERVPATVTELNLSLNVIETVNMTSVEKLTGLRVLDLSNNNITKIETEPVTPGISLKEIYLDHNKLEEVFLVYSTDKSDVISASFNQLTRVSYYAYSNGFCVLVKIKTLNVSHNCITDEGLRYLKSFIYNKFPVVMDFSFNRLEKIEFNYPVKAVYLHNNHISSVPSFWFYTRLPKIATLHNNQLKMLCSDLHTKIPLQITLRNNPLICSNHLSRIVRNTDVTDVDLTMCKMHLPRGVSEYENLAELGKRSFQEITPGITPSCPLPPHCNVTCPSNCQCYHKCSNIFDIIDCSTRNLTDAPNNSWGEKHNWESHQLYLDGNNIINLNASSFVEYSGLKILCLNGSQIKTIHPHAFYNLSKLEILHLENNQIEVIPRALFEGLHHLLEVQLSNNKLSILQNNTFHALMKLEILMLHNNSLQNFAVWELSKQSNLSHVSLTENPWSCDCNYIDSFHTWLLNLSSKVVDGDEIHCSSGPDAVTTTPLISMNFKKCEQLTKNPKANLAFTLISVFGAFIFLTVLSFLIYFYRREVRVLIYSRIGVRLFYKVDEADLDKEKTYDAFVAYSSQDEQFLFENLVFQLERAPYSYRLCLHHRDFQAGAFISENIIEAIEKSRRTIVILTENFIESEWCRFEFRMAYSQMMADKCNRLLIILPGKVPQNVDSETKSYLRTNTYLEWGDRLFWEKLQFAMPNKQPPMTTE